MPINNELYYGLNLQKGKKQKNLMKKLKELSSFW